MVSNIQITTLGGEGDCHYLRKAEAVIKLTAKIPESVLGEALDKAIAQVKDKFPDATPMSFYVSRRQNEGYLTFSVRMCVGGGDYINRIVQVPLTEIVWDYD